MFKTLKALFSGNKPKAADPVREIHPAPSLAREGEKEKETIHPIQEGGSDHKKVIKDSIPDGKKEKPVERPMENPVERSMEKPVERSMENPSQRQAESHPGEAEGEVSTPAGEDPAASRSRKKKDASRDFYRYLNQAIKTMHIRYSEGRFEELTHLGKIPAHVVEDYDQILEKLPEDLKAWVSTLRSMIVLRDEEGTIYTDIGDKEGIRREFLSSMLPFYGTYASKLGEGKVRFSSLIGPDMLRLFHELTGKKFSVGFHRRYESGINAFEWEDDRYQVFDSKGHLLCDATFKDGVVDHGYAEQAEADPEYEDWDLVKAGNWENGEFKNGAIRYVYRVKVE